MNSNKELETSINNAIDELQHCLMLLADVHPAFETFANRAANVIRNHICKMEALLELIKDNLDAEEEEAKFLVEEIFNDTMKIIIHTLELIGTFAEYAARIKDTSLENFQQSQHNYNQIKDRVNKITANPCSEIVLTSSFDDLLDGV